jgi:hypothetical protein
MTSPRAPWRITAARAMSLPRVQPIIPTWRKEPFDDLEWVFDFKYGTEVFFMGV